MVKNVGVGFAAITLVLTMVGCGTTQGSSKTTTPSNNAGGSQTNQTASFDPDNSTDKIDYSQLASKFGPVPDFAGKNITIGAVEKTMTNQYWQALADGYKAAAQKYGVKVDVQAAAGETDETGQLAIAQTMLEKNYRSLLVSPITNSNLDPAAQTATQKNIPVINVDDALMSTATVFVGNDQRENGVLAANWIAKHIGEKGQVAVIEGAAGVYATKERTAGFLDTIKKYPNIQVVGDVPGNWDRQTAMNDAANLIEKYPHIKAIYANNDVMALGVVQAVKNAGKLGKIIVIGTDGTSDALDSIKKGELTGTVDSFPEKTGEIGLEVALREIAGEKLPRVVTTPQALVTKDNMSQYIH
jgi:ribose transport system substrate-binding protein